MFVDLYCGRYENLGAGLGRYWNENPVTVMVKGLSTKGLVDEQQISTGRMLFRITGRTSFEKNGLTVFVLEPVGELILFERSRKPLVREPGEGLSYWST